MQEIIHRPAPPKHSRTSRLTAKLKALPVNPNVGIKLDLDTAKCLRSYAQYHGWKITQERDGAGMIIWRIG